MQCLEDHCALQSQSREQHVDLRSSRLERDRKDQEKLLFWFKKHDPRIYDESWNPYQRESSEVLQLITT